MHKLLMAACAAALLSAGVAIAQPAPGAGMRDFIAQADANHDGAITRAEWDAARAERFTQEDADHNGALSAAERPHWGGGGGGGGGADVRPPPAGGPPPGGPPGGGGAHHGMNADANNDGIVSRAEYDGQSAAIFQRLDSDANGVISAAELQAAHDHMHQH